VLILYGDAPLVTPATLKEMEGIKKSDPQVRAVVLGMESQDTQSYGRLITRPGAPQELERIVELKDATPEERQVTLCNSGIMLVTGSDLFTLLEQVQPSPHTQEYYLTDIVKGMKTLGGRCLTVKGPQSELAGINTRSELMAAEAWIQDRYRRQVLEGGATLRGAETVFFSHDTQVASDVIIEPHVVFAPGVILEEGCHILSFSHLADTRVGPGAHIGPFARLRGKTTVASQGEVGNFVEVKNTTVGKGAKIKHLSYVGDAQVGEKANIGAGAITANYDGTAKWHTHIGAGAMIGVNSVLIAPVTIGEKAMVAAGSVITKEVGPQDLAIGRVRQENHPNRALSLREKYEKRKKERQ
jgi:bifunctional UDP-N-acetylglucosamine pyrophosphorylase/glucosamine-1-phosphate N-acetyltransferase